MTISWSLRRWQCKTAVGPYAAELVPVVSNADVMRLALDAVSGDLAAASFLVVSLAPGDDASMSRALRVVSEAGTDVRVCIAVERSVLDRMDVGMIDDGSFGLMLDDVDVTTPLDALVSDRIEAVRFRPDFIGRASKNLRQGCALEAMLELSRNLGLCTLGADVVPGGASLAGHCEFDYIPAGAVGLRSVVARHPARTLTDGSRPRVLQPMIRRSADGSGTDFSWP